MRGIALTWWRLVTSGTRARGTRQAQETPMSAQNAPNPDDVYDLANARWEPPATEPYLFASFWQEYDDVDTCVVYDSDERSGDAWIETPNVIRRIEVR